MRFLLEASAFSYYPVHGFLSDKKHKHLGVCRPMKNLEAILTGSL